MKCAIREPSNKLSPEVMRLVEGIARTLAREHHFLEMNAGRLSAAPIRCHP